MRSWKSLPGILAVGLRAFASYAIALGLAVTFAASAAAQLAPGATPGAPSAPPQPRGWWVTTGVDIPLGSQVSQVGSGVQGEQSLGAPRLTLGLRYSPHGTLFARVAVHRYFEPGQRSRWNPDFTYSFGYDDWHPGTFALVYDNYTGNRLQPRGSRNEVFSRFDEGTISAAYKIPVSVRVERLLNPHPEHRLTAAIRAHLTPRYSRESGSRGEWKQSLSFAARNRFYRWWYVEGAAFYYPQSSQQQPWDPDFTYGFGYSDWHSGKVAIIYGNYAGNRFPWHDARKRGTFRDGFFSISFTNSW